MRTCLPSRPSRSVTDIPYQLVEAMLEDEEVVNGYVAAVLTPEARVRLLQAFPPIHPEVKAHHVTIAFNPTKAHYERRYAPFIGQTISIRVLGHASDEHAQAVFVDGVSENEFAHITISVAPGVPAKYSNELLSHGDRPVDPLDLQGVIRLEPLD